MILSDFIQTEINPRKVFFINLLNTFYKPTVTNKIAKIKQNKHTINLVNTNDSVHDSQEFIMRTVTVIKNNRLK